MMGHRLMGSSVNIAEARAHYDQALLLYEPTEHRPLAARFGQDVRVAILSNRSLPLWLLGYPEAALADAEQALKYARETSQAATLMFALCYTSLTCLLWADYAGAKALIDELVALANEKGALFWKASGILLHGQLCAVEGKATEAVEAITFSLAAIR